MILENYIIIEAFAIIFFLIAFFKRNILAWAVSAILFGANVFSAYSIQTNIYYMLSNGTITYTTFVNSYAPDAYVNIMFFAVCVIYALGDALTEGNYQTINR